MVCAVVSARISPNFIEKIHSVRLVPHQAKSLNLNVVADFINKACMCLPGIIIAESGDLYNLEVWMAKAILGRDFKYPETVAERTAVEMAHHVSVAGRRLITDAREDHSDERGKDRRSADEGESRQVC